MKKVLSIALATALAVSSAIPALADDITVIVNGEKIEFDDQTPIIKNDRVLVPLRGVLEEMGIEVTWNEFSESIYAQRGLAYALFNVGSSTLNTDSGDITLDAATEIINDRTMVPLRAIAEAFDADVEWDGETYTVTVTDSNTVTSVDEESIKTEYTAEDGTLLYTIDCVYPQLNGSVNAEGKSAINETIKNIITANLEPLEAEIKTAAEEWYSSDNTYFTALSIEGDYKVTYLTDDIVSLYYDLTADFHGVHPSTIREGITIDLKTGEELALSDFIDGDINTAIKSAYEKATAENPDLFFENIMDSFDDIIDEIDFYIEDDSVMLFAQLYAVAPYAGGFIPVKMDSEISEDSWSVELTATDVTSTSLKLSCTLVNGETNVEYDTGSMYWIEKKDDDAWVSVVTLHQGEDLAWTSEAYIIPTDGSAEWTINWEYLYGELPAGEYRIGKTIYAYRGAGDYEEAVYYSEFAIA
ncbi:MAG: DUF4163 domain-containing protein [Clostridiales bacterium]|nr:DUF4163 domain-containing protein [Clostridiales bacterium]